MGDQMARYICLVFVTGACSVTTQSDNRSMQKRTPAPVLAGNVRIGSNGASAKP
jgi:hypothetical protein